MSVPVVSKLKRLLDSLPRDSLPDVVASMIRTSNKEKLQVSSAGPHRYLRVLRVLLRRCWMPWTWRSACGLFCPC